MTANRSASSSCSCGQRGRRRSRPRSRRRQRWLAARVGRRGRARRAAACRLAPVRVQDRLAVSGAGAPLSSAAPVRGRYAALAVGALRGVSVSRNRSPSSARPRTCAKASCERSRSARPPFVIVHLTVALERSRSRRDRARRGPAGSGRPPRDCADGALSREQRTRHLGAARAEGGQRTVNAPEVRAAAHTRARARRRTRPRPRPKPRCRNAPRLAGAAAQRSRGLGQRRRVEREHVRETLSSARVRARARGTRHSTGAARGRGPLDGGPAHSLARQAHPGSRPKRSGPSSRSSSAATPRHVRAHDEQRLAGRQQVAEHAHAPSPRRSTTVRSAPSAHTGARRLRSAPS